MKPSAVAAWPVHPTRRGRRIPVRQGATTLAPCGNEAYGISNSR
jgi:hypothetical protein